MNSTHKDLKKVIKIIEQLDGPRVKKDKWRLGFHLMPPIGWLNDPNGLCYFKGKYHVFFQYSPFDPKGGIKVWGHYTSPNLVDWTYEGAPLLADQAEDCHGVYSGSTFVEDDKAYIYYTGNVKRLGDFDYDYIGREANTMLVETQDMKYFEPKQCIMTNKDYTEKMSCHVRDPKVWKEGDTYYMVQGARTKEDRGQVLVFESKDKKKWKLINEITSEERFGYMWECPDLFKVDGTTILSISPQGVEKQGFEFWNVYQSGYYVIDGDFRSTYSLNNFCELDRGFDFYAPQTFQDEKGRRILIGWMGLPDCEPEYHNPTVEKGWQHCLTISRELHFKEGKLFQNPVKEIESLRKQCIINNIEGKETLSVYSLSEIVVTDINSESGLSLIINEDVSLTFDAADETFTLEFLNATGAGRTKRIVSLKELRNLRVFCDYSALEIFINEGQEVFATRYYPEQRKNSIEVTCCKATVAVWELGEMKYDEA